ncbi:SubName: Full=Uncharacterized protein {ECO:0000313/EMBL:CCA74466.1} [Serendipita indica DSM 11827]|uniref:F-box domain-containing protein n=1 Tax=Serendipita indica (strain DSM 11827) TaxID=1109443 RepID=G4TT23_SERID|nr:SubName: Full=Uncharacterized protein {ECO:0000313/EMBL:CCA74466.1} [Serendipita indica DSM 11827]CCA74466.1 hypothetical protein PIIN_08419 [Serendipita indica DSM 11827]
MPTDNHNEMLLSLREFVEKYPVQELQDSELRQALQSYKQRPETSNPFGGNVLPEDAIFIILDYLPIQDAISFTQTCRAARRFHQAHFTHRVNKLLVPYVDPEKMHTFMRDTGSIISGSSALWLLASFPTNWRPNDLDVYCPLNATPKAIEFFVSEGYQVVSEYEPSNYTQRQLHSLARITKLARGEEQRIDLLESKTHNSFHPITVFHTTVVMNFISADFIVSLYPKATLSHVGASSYAHPAKPRQYQERGYSIDGHEVWSWLFCPALRRQTSDSYCLALPYRQNRHLGDVESGEWEFVHKNGTHALCPPHSAGDKSCDQLLIRRISRNVVFLLRQRPERLSRMPGFFMPPLERYLQKNMDSIVDYFRSGLRADPSRYACHETRFN